MSTSRCIELQKAKVTLVLRCDELITGAAYSSVLENESHILAITLFNLHDARIALSKFMQSLWLGNTWYALPLNELKRASEFLGIDMPSPEGIDA